MQQVNRLALFSLQLIEVIMSNNQDLTLIIEFIVTVPRDLWDGTELSFSNTDYSFYDADFISEVNDIVTASIKGETGVIFSNVDMVNDSFSEYGNTSPTNIMFGDYEAPITNESLYKIIEYGI
jgi:hypothetical protein